MLPHHLVNPDTYENTSLEAPIGSGPYRVGKVDPGRSITFERDPDYWGKDLPVNRGRFNFDQIRFDYFREGSVMFEAFKTGQSTCGQRTIRAAGPTATTSPRWRTDASSSAPSTSGFRPA